jgi:hypothetical protein
VKGFNVKTAQLKNLKIRLEATLKVLYPAPDATCRYNKRSKSNLLVTAM